LENPLNIIPAFNYPVAAMGHYDQMIIIMCFPLVFSSAMSQQLLLSKLTSRGGRIIGGIAALMPWRFYMLNM